MAQRPKQSAAMMAYYVGDNVEIGPDVAIAAGVVLEAATGSRLTIESGVCLGAGVVVQAHGGDLTVSAGTSLGRDVLVVGTGIIGMQVCVGAESTLINPHIGPNQTVAARSLLIDNQRQALGVASANDSEPSNGHVSHNGTQQQSDTVNSDENGSVANGKVVYGREQVMQLLNTLLPHRKALNQNGAGEESS